MVTTEAGRLAAIEFTVALVGRPNGGGLTWAENEGRAEATVAAIEAEARTAALASVREAVEAELELLPDEPEQFGAGAAAAYNWVLAALLVERQSDAEGSRR